MLKKANGGFHSTLYGADFDNRKFILRAGNVTWLSNEKGFGAAKKGKDLVIKGAKVDADKIDKTPGDFN